MTFVQIFTRFDLAALPKELLLTKMERIREFSPQLKDCTLNYAPSANASDAAHLASLRPHNSFKRLRAILTNTGLPTSNSELEARLCERAEKSQFLPRETRPAWAKANCALVFSFDGVSRLQDNHIQRGREGVDIDSRASSVKCRIPHEAARCTKEEDKKRSSIHMRCDQRSTASPTNQNGYQIL